MPPQIRKFAKQILNGPTKEINIAISKPAENILQLAFEVEDHAKIALTEKVLEVNKRLDRVIILAGRKKTVKDLAGALQRKGIEAGAIHSDLSQEEREQQLHSFKSGSKPVIVATDVLSRGIDIKGIDAVINFDVPGDAEDYVHRIGRTARAEASGMAFTYINGEDMYRFKRIEDLIERRVQRLPLPKSLKMLSLNHAVTEAVGVEKSEITAKVRKEAVTEISGGTAQSNKKQQWVVMPLKAHKQPIIRYLPL